MHVFNKIKLFDPPGRFLKYEKLSLRWEQISDNKAMEKIMQALREVD